MQITCFPTSTSLHLWFLCIGFIPTLLRVLIPNGSLCLNSGGIASLVRCPSSIHYNTYHIVWSFPNVIFMIANQTRFIKEPVLVSKNAFQLWIIPAKEHQCLLLLKKSTWGQRWMKADYCHLMLAYAFITSTKFLLTQFRPS